ncbi:MAG TPA: MOSC N-terminal beta barrel domain-containing protein [Polyangiaceae bacterium]
MVDVSSVVALHVYPVKGCRGVTLDTARVERRGLAHDRRWMLVDGDGKFVTQRTEPRLARIEVAIEGEALILSTEGHGALLVQRPPLEAPRRRVRVWSDEVDAVDAGTDVAEWLCGVLGSETSLVFMPETTSRPVRPEYGRPDDVVSFADALPLLFTTLASLDELNARMRQPLPMNRFRPNIVVQGTAPWAEDGWTHVRVGELGVRVVKACDRCVVTTTDQLTGARGVEPLRTLSTFRERERKVYFGVNAIPNVTGTIRVGDAVTVPG